MTQISDIFVDPDNVGESEYRVIYELLDDAWQDIADDSAYSADEKINHLAEVLTEVIHSAEAMKRRLKIWKQCVRQV
jgi:hypothetical protein